MNGKVPTAPLVGELIQVAAALAIAVDLVFLAAIKHHWGAALTAALAITAYFVGRSIRNRL
jgi:hypothetical protein